MHTIHVFLILFYKLTVTIVSNFQALITHQYSIYFYFKFKANDLKGIQVMNKINLQGNSSSHIHSNVHIKLNVVVLIEYT